jgi:hypothetical protein
MNHMTPEAKVDLTDCTVDTAEQCAAVLRWLDGDLNFCAPSRISKCRTWTQPDIRTELTQDDHHASQRCDGMQSQHVDTWLWMTGDWTGRIRADHIITSRVVDMWRRGEHLYCRTQSGSVYRLGRRLCGPEEK